MTPGTAMRSCACSSAGRRTTAAPGGRCSRGSAQPRIRSMRSELPGRVCCCPERTTNCVRPWPWPSAPSPNERVTKWGHPYFEFVHGLAEYRQGQFDRAIATMQGDASGVLGPAPRLVLALSLHRSGQATEARKTLAAAILAHDWRAMQVRARDPERVDLSHSPPRGRGHDPAETASVPTGRLAAARQ